MRQLPPETGEYQCNIFQNIDPNVFVFLLFFDLLYQRGYQGQLFFDTEFKIIGL